MCISLYIITVNINTLYIYINMVTNDMMCFLNKDGYLMEL